MDVMDMGQGLVKYSKNLHFFSLLDDHWEVSALIWSRPRTWLDHLAKTYSSLLRERIKDIDEHLDDEMGQGLGGSLMQEHPSLWILYTLRAIWVRRWVKSFQCWFLQKGEGLDFVLWLPSQCASPSNFYNPSF